MSRHTKPGGWVECIDLDVAWTSPDNSLKPEMASLKFNHEFLKASRAANMEPCPGPLLEGWMKDAGLKDVKSEKFVWPVGTWPADKHLVSTHSITDLETFLPVTYQSLGNRRRLAPGTTCRSRKDSKLSRMRFSRVSWATRRRSAMSSVLRSDRR